MYRPLNALFHLLHLGIILFVMLAWSVPVLLPWHLLLTSLTLVCWFVLGLWLGIGFCPLSHWHWQLKQEHDSGRPRESYIHYVVQKASGRQFEGDLLDRLVVACTLLLFCVSVWRNLQYWTS